MMREALWTVTAHFSEASASGTLLYIAPKCPDIGSSNLGSSSLSESELFCSTLLQYFTLVLMDD